MQPIAAPSVGVAQPVMIEPSVAMMSAAGGTRPKMNHVRPADGELVV
jgi:hypothetical protein